MKKSLPKFLIVLLIFFLGCSKSVTYTTTDNNLLGKWILIETLSDPGDGSGTWKTTNTPTNFVYFIADSIVKTNVFIGLGGATKYKLINDSTIRMFYANGDSILNRLKINENILTLTGGCIEACGAKFKRAEF